jgi:ElaB/YqjD/DUF883 family membrane-anchored ribosome-binding protein
MSNNITDRISNAADSVKDQLQEGYEQVKGFPDSKMVRNAKKEIKKARNNASRYIEDNPYESAWIALGIGVALGFLLSRSRD